MTTPCFRLLWLATLSLLIAGPLARPASAGSYNGDGMADHVDYVVAPIEVQSIWGDDDHIVRVRSAGTASLSLQHAVYPLGETQIFVEVTYLLFQQSRTPQASLSMGDWLFYLQPQADSVWEFVVWSFDASDVGVVGVLDDDGRLDWSLFSHSDELRSRSGNDWWFLLPDGFYSQSVTAVFEHEDANGRSELRREIRVDHFEVADGAVRMLTQEEATSLIDHFTYK